MFKKILGLFLINTIVMFCLSGCGQTGPLYLPDQAPKLAL